MRWREGRRSTNVEDRRGSRPRARRGLKLGGGATLVLVAVVLLAGGDARQVLSLLMGGQGDGAASVTQQDHQRAPAAQDKLADFASVVLADTEDTWPSLLQPLGHTYRAPKLVLFRGAVQSACGFSQAAIGPFYCPPDQKVYIDLSFFDELAQRFGAPGDFAQAYVIAHEIGHHIQTLLGTSRRVQAARRRADKATGNALSVRQELQADCYAGVWAHHAQRARKVLEQGDLEEALRAAAAIADDRLQRKAGGVVQPESFTHGTSAQRQRWFRRGFDSGKVGDCDTFSSQPR